MVENTTTNVDLQLVFANNSSSSTRTYDCLNNAGNYTSNSADSALVVTFFNALAEFSSGTLRRYAVVAKLNDIV